MSLSISLHIHWECCSQCHSRPGL